MNPAKILIIDDEPHMRRITEFSLRSGGFKNFLFAQDGAEAVTILRDQLPDLIILDYFMPNMNGLETLDFLKTTPSTKGIPVIMMSGCGEFHAREHPVERGAALLLTKPYRPTELLEQSRRLIIESLATALSS
jgi:CheY-like chemotaxis protein